MSIVNLTVDLVFGFFALFIATKILGKTQISQITPFDFISAIVLGELLGNALYDDQTGILFILYALFLWTTLIFIVEILGQKFLKLRPFFQGNPSIVIRNGMIDRNLLKKNRVNLNHLQTLLREQNVFSFREVEYGILETDGSLSVLKKSNYQKPTRQDLNLQQKGVFLPVTLISDGKVLWDNLSSISMNKEWLEQQLSALGINNVRDVFYAEWLEGDGLHIVPMNIE